jgi:hypothetical protein
MSLQLYKKLFLLEKNDESIESGLYDEFSDIFDIHSINSIELIDYLIDAIFKQLCTRID